MSRYPIDVSFARLLGRRDVFYASANIVRLGVLCILAIRLCISICPSIMSIVYTMSRKVLDIFTTLPALVHFGTGMNASSFVVRRSKFKLWCSQTWRKCTFWPCECGILKITGVNFRLLAFMYLETRITASFFRSKGRRSGSQHDQGPRRRRLTELSNF